METKAQKRNAELDIMLEFLAKEADQARKEESYYRAEAHVYVAGTIQELMIRTYPPGIPDERRRRAIARELRAKAQEFKLRAEMFDAIRDKVTERCRRRQNSRNRPLEPNRRKSRRLLAWTINRAK